MLLTLCSLEGSMNISHFWVGAANASGNLTNDPQRVYKTLPDSESKQLQISEQTPSPRMEISGKVHSLTSSESTSCRECACICVRRALQKHIVKISGQEGLYCVAEAECSSYSPAAGPGAWGWHQHKDKNVMWGISKASFKARPQAALYTRTLSLFNNIW